jgi:hypothetical protein
VPARINDFSIWDSGNIGASSIAWLDGMVPQLQAGC